MILQIPLEPIPNQLVSTRINGNEYAVEVNTRLDKLYITLWVNGALELINRALLSFAPVTQNLILVDMEGMDDGHYSGLGSRFILVWTDE